ncbi:potassium channel family protein [Leptolyngbya sp. AN02str]|uniref:potassium channel family protein n=1 Tax=Leptolyngbya sp. AN02str TaxID=3423363 RepID=UPI003D323417
MNFLLLGLGVLLVATSILDALWTVLWVNGGAGPVTNQVTSGIWWIIVQGLRIKRHDWLSLGGPVTQVVTMMVWLGLLWVGWVFIFSADPASIIHSEASNQPLAALSDRIYFVAYTITTFGNGELYPQRGGWQLMTSLAAFTGILLITMVVSFLLSVVSGVTTKQSLTSQIIGLGSSAEELVLNSWNGREFSGLDLQLALIASQLGKLTEQQIAYPILQYYHGASVQKGSAPAIAILDEALTILTYGIQKPYRPSPASLISTRAAVQNYLKTVKSAGIQAVDLLPPAPDLALLRRAGIPVVSNEEFMQALPSLDDRRRLLLGFVQQSCFHWPDHAI